ncbi:MAG: hypothetical protein LBC28_03810 [Oscillospiraceae bacterium]|jgi:hypothetical protein|nr:hypothetical protein [Oscillospiraceae bacterium]
MKKVIKNLISSALIAALMLALISGCAKTGGDDASPSGKPDAGKPVPGIFTAEKIELTGGAVDVEAEAEAESTDGDTGGTTDAVSNIVYANGRLYYSYQTIESGTNDDGEYYSEGKTYVMSANIDGSDPAVILGPLTSLYDSSLDRNESVYLQYLEADAGGNIWVGVYKNVADETDPLNIIYETSYTFAKYAPDGAELISFGAEDIPGYDPNQDFIQDLALDGAGNVYLYAYSGAGSKIAALSGETGAHLFTVTEQGSLNELMRLGSGEVGYLVYDNMTGGRKLKVIDLTTRAAVEKPYAGRTDVNSLYTGYGDYDFLFFASSTLYGCSVEKQSYEPVVLFFDSGINIDYLESIVPLDDGGFIVSFYNYADIDMSKRGVYLLKPNLDPAFGEKKVITLGGLSLDQQMRAAALAFNKTSASTRITFKDYSEYNTPEDYGKGAAQLDLDILGGRAPDIISLTNLSTRKYASKGIFTDLYPLLDADTQLRREDLFENILKMGEYDGKLTSVITSFQLMTTAGKKSIFGDRTVITAEELASIADANPDSQLFRNMTIGSWMSYIMMLTLDDFVDWDTGVCAFNSPEFIKILELAKRFPKEIDYNNIDWQEEQTEAAEALESGKTLLTIQSIYNPRALRDARYMFGGEEDVVFVGFPTTGASGAVVTPQGAYAILEASPYKTEAWGFISELLRKTEESGGFDDSFVMFTNKTIFEKRAAAELTPLLERDFSNGLVITLPSQGGGSMAFGVNSRAELEQMIPRLEANGMITEGQLLNYHLTEAEVDAARAVIEGADKAGSNAEAQISNIITEEVEAFAAGAKSAEETAKVIQSRVQLFVSESM